MLVKAYSFGPGIELPKDDRRRPSADKYAMKRPVTQLGGQTLG